MDAFELSPATDAMLTELSERNGLSRSALLEILVSQAHALKWTALAPLSVSVPLANEQIEYELLKLALYQDQFTAICSAIEKESVTTWLGLGRIGASKLGLYKGIGEFTINDIRRVLKGQNVILGR